MTLSFSFTDFVCHCTVLIRSSYECINGLLKIQGNIRTPVSVSVSLMENPTTADAFLDRLVHTAHRLVLQGESMRKCQEGVESEKKPG